MLPSCRGTYYALAFSTTLSIYVATYPYETVALLSLVLTILGVLSVDYADRTTVNQLIEGFTICGARPRYVLFAVVLLTIVKCLILSIPPSIVLAVSGLEEGLINPLLAVAVGVATALYEVRKRYA